MGRVGVLVVVCVRAATGHKGEKRAGDCWTPSERSMPPTRLGRHPVEARWFEEGEEGAHPPLHPRQVYHLSRRSSDGGRPG